MISLESSSIIENFQGMTRQGHHVHIPDTGFSHPDAKTLWIQGISDL